MDLEKILTKEQISYFTKIILKKNETLLREGERISLLYYLKEGEINIISTSLSGQEITNSINKGEMIGNALIFIDEKTTGRIVSKHDSLLLSISKDNLVKLFMKNKTFLEEYLKELSIKTFNLKNENKMLHFKTLEERLFYYLSYNQEVVYNVTHLSKKLSCSREALSSTLNLLIKENKIMVKEGKITFKKIF